MNRGTGEQSEGKTAKDQQTHLVPEGTVADIQVARVPRLIQKVYVNQDCAFVTRRGEKEKEKGKGEEEGGG